jgi:hypothetical protein
MVRSARAAASEMELSVKRDLRFFIDLPPGGGCSSRKRLCDSLAVLEFAVRAGLDADGRTALPAFATTSVAPEISNGG